LVEIDAGRDRFSGVFGRGESGGNCREDVEGDLIVDARFEDTLFFLVSATVLVSGLVGKPALKGGEIGSGGDLVVFCAVLPEIPSPRPVGLSGGSIKPASRIAFSSSTLVGSLTGDLGRPGDEGDGSADRPQIAAAPLTETFDKSSSCLSGDRDFTGLSGLFGDVCVLISSVSARCRPPRLAHTADIFLLGSVDVGLASSPAFFEGSVFSKASGTSFSEIVDHGLDVDVEVVSEGSVGLLHRVEELFGEITDVKDSRFDGSSS
jgi:hypothetical protein